jgi:SAM-dependent methyltransferase
MHKSIEERSSVLEKKNPVLTTLNDVPSSSQDIVISTLVLCSVDNQDEAIGQIMRVLKPGGKLLFLEHVIEIDQGYPAPYNIDVFDWGRATYRWAQQALSPLQVRVETPTTIRPRNFAGTCPSLQTYRIVVWLVRKLTCPRFLCTQVALADGCHPARDTMAMINEAFTDVFFKRFDVPYLWGKDDWASFFPIGPQVLAPTPHFCSSVPVSTVCWKVSKHFSCQLKRRGPL